MRSLATGAVLCGENKSFEPFQTADRPGALGAVASALGHAGADILSVDIVERSEGQATDDLVVALPADRLADSLVSAAASVEGVGEKGGPRRRSRACRG